MSVDPLQKYTGLYTLIDPLLSFDGNAAFTFSFLSTYTGLQTLNLLPVIF